MNPEQQQALLGIAMMAAFADGANDEREREQIRSLAESLAAEPGAPDLPNLYRRVLLRQFDLAGAVAALDDPNLRQLAYETAVCVCDADGVTGDAERRFLAELAAALGLAAAATAPVVAQAEAIAREAAAPGPVVATVPKVDEAEIDRSILNQSILCGALELLPQSWASMAIIPLQMRMVYAVGRQYGHELDQGHIRELLATLGVGLTSQYLEQFGRKLIGGLLGKLGGGIGKAVGRAATGVALSFATTYALGQVAKRYYAGGRTMSTELLRQSFQQLLGPARELQSRYLPQIEQQAAGLDAGRIMEMVRGYRP